jgi:hypothetical protein
MSMASQRFISACGVLPCEDVPERAALAASSVATRIRPLRPLIWGRQRFCLCGRHHGAWACACRHGSRQRYAEHYYGSRKLRDIRTFADH